MSRFCDDGDDLKRVPDVYWLLEDGASPYRPLNLPFHIRISLPINAYSRSWQFQGCERDTDILGWTWASCRPQWANGTCPSWTAPAVVALPSVQLVVTSQWSAVMLVRCVESPCPVWWCEQLYCDWRGIGLVWQFGVFVSVYHIRTSGKVKLVRVLYDCYPSDISCSNSGKMSVRSAFYCTVSRIKWRSEVLRPRSWKPSVQ